MQTEDKIKHCLIRVNQLKENREHIKYIIPQIHTAVPILTIRSKCSLRTPGNGLSTITS